MKVKIYFEAKTDDGQEFGVAFDIGESETSIDYSKLTAGIDKDKVLEFTGLNGMIQSENFNVITPEEYKERFEDD